MSISRRNFLTANALSSQRDVLVCVFQRGAADGLNSVVPYGDSNYALQRENLALAAPSALDPAATLNLDGFFGLHPALQSLLPIYLAGDLALVHATGVPHGSRSHFDAQGLVERGLVSKAGPNTGWLGRHLAQSQAITPSAFRVVAVSGNVPVSLWGAQETMAISNLDEFGFDQGIIDSGFLGILTSLYGPSSDLNASAQAALQAVVELQAANLPELMPDNGALYPDSVLAKKMLQASALIKSNLPTEVICIDSDGWDHHDNLPQFLNQSLSELGQAMAAFYTDMGSRMANITLLVMTEFGRRVAKNNSNGVDHGTGGLAYVMGKGVNGGQVVADWPGLAAGDLDRGDLAITTDLRSLLGELIQKRLGGGNVSELFPGFAGVQDLGLFNSR